MYGLKTFLACTSLYDVVLFCWTFSQTFIEKCLSPFSLLSLSPGPTERPALGRRLPFFLQNTDKSSLLEQSFMSSKEKLNKQEEHTVQHLLNKQYGMEQNGMSNGTECCGLEDKTCRALFTVDINGMLRHQHTREPLAAAISSFISSQ